MQRRQSTLNAAAADSVGMLQQLPQGSVCSGMPLMSL
jgi:hypothetical protein